MALAALSKGQLLDMLRSAVLLSPVAYVGQMTSIVRALAEHHIGEASLFTLTHPLLNSVMTVENKMHMFFSD